MIAHATLQRRIGGVHSKMGDTRPGLDVLQLVLDCGSAAVLEDPVQASRHPRHLEIRKLEDECGRCPGRDQPVQDTADFSVDIAAQPGHNTEDARPPHPQGRVSARGSADSQSGARFTIDEVYLNIELERLRKLQQNSKVG